MKELADMVISPYRTDPFHANLCTAYDELREALAASQRREQSLSEQVVHREQMQALQSHRDAGRIAKLQARLAAAQALIAGWRNTEQVLLDQGNNPMAAGYFNCAEDLEAALAVL